MSEQQNGKQATKDAGTAVALTEKAQPIVVAPNVTALEQSIDQAEKYLKALDRIRKMAIMLTNYTDWIDENGKPYLEAAGCSKIAGAFGIKTINVSRNKEVCKDDKGEYLRFITEGSGEWHTSTAHEIGSASTRDDFFAKRVKWATGADGARTKEEYLLPLSEVDLGDVEKKSFTNFMNRLIKRLLGLSFTWEEIAEYSSKRITREQCTGVKFGERGSKGANTTATAPAAAGERASIWKQLLDVNDGETERAAAHLEKLTAYKYNDATVPGKRDINKLSDKSVAILKDKVAKLHAEWEKATGGQGGDEPPPQDDPNA
jgi:hypothetical protein